MSSQKFETHISFFVRFLSRGLFFVLDIFYGKEPSLGKMRVLEVVARIPYQAWEILNYFKTTHGYTDEQKAIALYKDEQFPRFAQDNETMHVVVITQICKKEKKGNGYFRFHLIPVLATYFYGAFCTIFYFFTPRKSYELNYVFELHAEEVYQTFLDQHPEFKDKQLHSAFLQTYGRTTDNYYDFFSELRDDEKHHRMATLKAIQDLDNRKQNRS